MKIIFLFFVLVNIVCTLAICNEAKSKEKEEDLKPHAIGERKNEENSKGTEEKEKTEIIDFSSIKDIIKKDGLEAELKKKQDEKKKAADEKKKFEVRKYNVPTEDVFWSFFSEYWLVKNASRLKWDFHKPDFDLEKAFASMLESQGIYEKKFKILLVDSTEVFHAALPTNEGESIFVLSLPFIRTLDLSKVEISILLFEDYLRIRKGYFKNYVGSKDLDAFLGSNFTGKPFNKKIMDDLVKKYNSLLFEKGFSFQEQYEVTKEMDTMLKNDMKIWNTYLTMIGKIDDLVKNNVLYKNYNQIYPSPELQMNWLKPKALSL